MRIVKRRFIDRLTSALRRRTALAWTRITCAKRHPDVVEATLNWLLRSTPSSPALIGESVRTALQFGECRVANRWAKLLACMQLPNGAMPDPTSSVPSLFQTAYATKGLLSIGDKDRTRKACDYLLSEADKARPDDCLICLSIVSDAAGVLNLPEWQANVDRLLAKNLCKETLVRCDIPAPNFVRRIESLIQLNQDSLASTALGNLPKVDISTGGLVAWILYRLKRQAEADRIMQWLVQKRRSLTLNSAWASVYFLNAAFLQVQSSFDIGATPLPNLIEDSDGRMQTVRRWIETLPNDARVADVGCGSGRFLQRLIVSYPNARLTGVDVSEPLLAKLPSKVERLSGSLLRMPIDDGAMDGAFAVESVEHSLIPKRAIAELCRVVRPGGRVLVIDKNIAKQPLSEHDPWERWFSPDELVKWLKPFCGDVKVEPLQQSAGQSEDNLFFVATGTRHRE